MKKVILFLLLTALAYNVNAQTKKPIKKAPATRTTATAKPAPVRIEPKVDEYSVMDKNFLDPGIGVGSYYKGLPFGVAFEHGFTDEISAGVFANYSSYNYAEFGDKLNILYTGIRGSYHLAKLFNITNSRFDPYGGVSLGYYHVSFNGTDFIAPYSSTVFFGVHAGARYMFSNKVGGFAEAGYGVSALQVGLSFKL